MEASASQAAHEQITDEGVEGGRAAASAASSSSFLVPHRRLSPVAPGPEPSRQAGLSGELMMGFMNK